MVNGLSKVNGEMIHLPKIQVKGIDWSRIDRETKIRFNLKEDFKRFSIILECEHGAIELWEEPYVGKSLEIMKNSGLIASTHFGGVEKHLRTPGEYETPLPNCYVLGGANCYTDGSGLAYDVFYPLLHGNESINSEKVLQELFEYFTAWMSCTCSE